MKGKQAFNHNKILKFMDFQVIQNKIFEVRGCRVMLDFHLAELYQVETRALKQAVKRNIGRFPSDFMFVLSKEEANLLLSIGVSQNVIPPDYNFGAALPMAFTEQGVPCFHPYCVARPPSK